MKKGLLPALLFFSLMLAAALPAFAQDILLSHTLTGFTEDAETATLDITVNVENIGPADINNLTLDYVPLMFIAIDPVSISLAGIGAGQAVDVPITIVTPLPFDQIIFEQAPLFWAGEHDNPDGSGALVEFPAESRDAGGAL